MISHRDYRRIEAAIAYIRDHYAEQPSVDRVAAAVHLSPAHFSRLFRRWAGIPPHQFLRVVTARAAEPRLAAEPSLLHVSHGVGLSGPGRLHDLFVDLEAMSPGEFKALGEGVDIRYGAGDSPFGRASVAVTPRGVCALEFIGDDGLGVFRASLAARWSRARLTGHDDPQGVLDAIFGGRPAGPPALHVAGTNFQIRVWKALLALTEGAVTSYGEIARGIGEPGAARAVGRAVGANPVAWIIPCHRVLRRSGATGGYRWGPARKQVMLDWESARVA